MVDSYYSASHSRYMCRNWINIHVSDSLFLILLSSFSYLIPTSIISNPQIQIQITTENKNRNRKFDKLTVGSGGVAVIAFEEEQYCNSLCVQSRGSVPSYGDGEGNRFQRAWNSNGGNRFQRAAAFDGRGVMANGVMATRGVMASGQIDRWEGVMAIVREWSFPPCETARVMLKS